MSLVKLGVVFAVIVVLLCLKRPLWQAMLGGLVATVLLFRFPPLQILVQTSKVFTSWSSLSVLISLYLITFLQRMLASRDQIKLSQQDLNGLFHNRRVNASGAPLFIGLLPSAAAMILCGDIVRDATDGYLDVREQAFITSWFRHIPESILPTYTPVLLMTTLSGIALPNFMLGMLAPTVLLYLVGYFVCLRRLPRDPGTAKSENRWKDALGLIRHLWTLLLVFLLIIVFKLGVVPALGISIAAGLVVYRFSPKEILPMLKSAFVPRLIVNAFLVLVLKEFIAYTGVLELLPEVLSKLPIPAWLVFAIMFFVGSVISGSSAIIALGTPLAFAAIPDGGMPLVALLMCMCHAAMQISPTHVCLAVTAEYYDITLGALIKKSLPRVLIFSLLAIGYYLAMTAIF